MNFNDFLVVREAYAAWVREDFDALARCFAPDVEFDVPASATVRSYLCRGQGREALIARLRAFVENYEVRCFASISAIRTKTAVEFRVRYDYRSRDTGLDIQGFQRHIWTVRGNELTSLTVLHDAHRLAAFFDLTDPLPT